MADAGNIFNEIMNVQIGGIPVIFIIAGLVFLFLFLLKIQRNKKDKYKAVNTSKEIQKDLDELFKLSHEKTGLWLKSGTVNLGYILEAVRMVLPEAKLKSKNIKANDPNSLEAVKKEIENKKAKGIKFYAFKLAGCNLIKRQFQKAMNKIGINLGLKYIVIEEELLTISDYNIIVNPYCLPSYYFNTWIYTNASMDFIDNIAIKLKHQLLIDSLVNTVPKQTYLEIKQSKDMEQLNAISKIKKDRQKEMLEEISKGNV